MSLCIYILAGGLGKRMKSPIPKVLHKINEYSLLGNIINKIINNIDIDIFVVTGKYHLIIKYQLEEELGIKEQKINYINQSESLGTGHALQCGYSNISSYKGVIVLNGDVPFIDIDTLKNVISNSNNDCMLGICKMEFLRPEWRGHGRIVMNENKEILRIVEEKDCNDAEREITTINGGMYYFNMNILEKYIHKLNSNNKQNEYYITDYIDLFVKNNYKVNPIYLTENEILNVNTPEQLLLAKSILN